jgi:hypothetical protein
MEEDEISDDDDKELYPAKYVHLMECIPADEESQKQPVTVITFAFNDEIESPLMLSLAETEKLLTGLLASLASHGDEMATEILDKYYIKKD